MATINPVVANVSYESGGISAQTITWTGITAQSDTVGAYDRIDLGDRSIQVTGNFNGGTVQLQGSNDGVSFFPLTTPAGVTIQFTAPGLLQVTEACLFVQPVFSTATTGANVTAVMAARRTMRGG
jgi:hypothetical protein